MAFYDAERRRENQARANLIEDVATAYAGCRTDKGLATKRKLIELFRAD